MGFVLDTTVPRDVGGGQTGVERVESFANIRTEGIADMARELIKLAQRMGASDGGQRFLDQAVREASKSVRELYVENISDVTGNLARSVGTAKGRKKVPGVGIAVTGPRHRKASKEEWALLESPPANDGKAAGNHAWLVEFGTGRRKPGTQGRRVLLTLHQKVNGKFNRRNRSISNDENFGKMSRSGGAYFIMGSKNTLGRNHGSGYPHDFIMALAPGQTFGAMIAQHPMEKAIKRAAPVVQRDLAEAVRKRINAFGGAA